MVVNEERQIIFLILLGLCHELHMVFVNLKDICPSQYSQFVITLTKYKTVKIRSL